MLEVLLEHAVQAVTASGHVDVAKYDSILQQISQSFDDVIRNETVSLVDFTKGVEKCLRQFPVSAPFMADLFTQKLFHLQLDVMTNLSREMHQRFEERLTLMQLYFVSLLDILGRSPVKRRTEWAAFFSTLRSLVSCTFQSARSLVGLRSSLIATILACVVTTTSEIDEVMLDAVCTTMVGLLEGALPMTSLPEGFIHTPFFEESVRMVLIQQELRFQHEAERKLRHQRRSVPGSSKNERSLPQFWNETVMNQFHATQHLSDRSHLDVAKYPPHCGVILSVMQQWNIIHRSSRQHLPLTLLKHFTTVLLNNRTASTKHAPFHRDSVLSFTRLLFHPVHTKAWIEAKCGLFQPLLRTTESSDQAEGSDLTIHRLLLVLGLFLLKENHMSPQIPSNDVTSLKPDAESDRSWLVIVVEDLLRHARNPSVPNKQRLHTYQWLVFLVCHGAFPHSTREEWSSYVYQTWSIGVAVLSDAAAPETLRVPKARDKWLVQNMLAYLLCHRAYCLDTSLTDSVKMGMAEEMLATMRLWLAQRGMVPVLRLYVALYLVPAMQGLLAVSEDEIPIDDSVTTTLVSIFTEEDEQHLREHETRLLCPLVGDMLLGAGPTTLKSPTANGLASIGPILLQAGWLLPLVEWPAESVAGSDRWPCGPLVNPHRWRSRDVLAIRQRAMDANDDLSTNEDHRMYAVSTSRRRLDYLSRLPVELVLHICQYLPYRRVVRLGLTNKSMHYAILSNQALWKALYRRTFPRTCFLSEVSTIASQTAGTADMNYAQLGELRPVGLVFVTPPHRLTASPPHCLTAILDTTTNIIESAEDCPTCLMASMRKTEPQLRLLPCRYRGDRHQWDIRFQVSRYDSAVI